MSALKVAGKTVSYKIISQHNITISQILNEVGIARCMMGHQGHTPPPPLSPVLIIIQFSEKKMAKIRFCLVSRTHLWSFHTERER